MSKNRQVPSRSMHTYNLSPNRRHLDQLSSQSDDDYIANVNQQFEDSEHSRGQIDRYNEKIEELQDKMKKLKLKNRQLSDLNELAQKRNQKHQQKQRQLIKKLSYEQVTNKQLQYQIKKLAQQHIQLKQGSKNNETKMWQFNQTIKKANQEKMQFILVIKRLCQALGQAQSHQQYVMFASKIEQFLRKNILNYEKCEITNSPNFDLKFESGRIETLKQKNNQLEQTVQKLKRQLENQKNQKKKIMNSYNEKIQKLKQACDSLRSKVQKKQIDNQDEIRNMRKVIEQKNELISDLKNRLQYTSQPRREPGSRKKRKSFIGDGSFYEDIQLNDLQNQIEALQKKLIRELRQ